MKKSILIFVLIAFCLIPSFVAQTGAPIRIGAFFDLSGQTAGYGEASRNGIRLAVDEINAAGGISGRKLKIFVEDDQGRPEKAKEVVKKLIEEIKVDVLLGEVASTNSLAAAFVAQGAGIPMITPASTNKKVTEVGDFIFRTCFIDPFQGEAMAKFAFYELKARRVAILGDVNSDYSKGLQERFSAVFIELGGKIVDNRSYTQVDPDFKAQLVKMRSRKPDALYVPGYYGEVGIIAKQARQLRMTMPILGGDGWDSYELWKLGGSALNNTYITNHFAVDNPATDVRDFVKKYEAKFRTKPDALAALAYDSVYVLADALRRANSTDGDILRDALARTANISGVTGKILRLDADRNAIKPLVIQKLNPKISRFVYQKTVEP